MFIPNLSGVKCQKEEVPGSLKQQQDKRAEKQMT